MPRTALEQMKLVFRLADVGFSLPVDHLVEVCQEPVGRITPVTADSSSSLLGTLSHRQGELPVYDLGRQLLSSAWAGSNEVTLLVLSGHAGPWAIPVDEVVGFFSADDFTPLQSSPLLQFIPIVTGLRFERWREELLVAGDAAAWEAVRD